ncbi:hypothetical protein M405DRAFT_15067 [Rhizopogon salebrosus TDB-379]|nr:hypothetical protein M405DRAFT_15067 [Rhizopogon salebrosus TDB-379]
MALVVAIGQMCVVPRSLCAKIPSHSEKNSPTYSFSRNSSLCIEAFFLRASFARVMMATSTMYRKEISLNRILYCQNTLFYSVEVRHGIEASYVQVRNHFNALSGLRKQVPREECGDHGIDSGYWCSAGSRRKRRICCSCLM